MERALDDLVDAFRTCRLPKGEWTHHAHLAVGLWHVATHGPQDALDRLRVGIRALNTSHAVANIESAGYHETITRAYVALLSQWWEATPGDDAPAHVAALLASPLARPNVLLHFYSKERLMSAAARAEWIEPDLAPLALAALNHR